RRHGQRRLAIPGRRTEYGAPHRSQRDRDRETRLAGRSDDAEFDRSLPEETADHRPGNSTKRLTVPGKSFDARPPSMYTSAYTRADDMTRLNAKDARAKFSELLD